MIFDSRICALGEGPLWHPTRQQLFWFDILGKRMLSQSNSEELEWQFDEYVSAAGWIDDDNLLIASETGLSRFEISSGDSEWISGLEVDNQITRSNDGRADPFGGFWIGTMGKNAEIGAGSIYRYYRGEIRRVVKNITISNAICFSPDGLTAYYCDTSVHKIMRLNLDEDGWPEGKAALHIDLTAENLNPDGAVVDAEGCLWSAQWGASRVARYAPDGTFMSAIDLPASQISCPAFGGADLTTLFATSAAVGVTEENAGQTFAIETGIKGQIEHQVEL